MPPVGGTPLPTPKMAGIGDAAGAATVPVGALVVAKLKLHRLSVTRERVYAFA